MKNVWLICFTLPLFLVACKGKKQDEKKEKFFPVLSFIRSQVAQVDTSLFPIRKITILDSLHSDTSFVKREDFRGLAHDFLDLPDITDDKHKGRFTESSMYDEMMKRLILSYKPVDAEKEEIQKEDVLMAPGLASGDEVSNIIIERLVGSRDGSLHQNLLWQVNQSFQVTTTTQKPGEPEKTTTLKVSWNEKDEK